MTEYHKEKFYDEYSIKKGNTVIAIVDSGSNANKICDELNNLYEEKEEIAYLHKRQVDNNIEYKLKVRKVLKKQLDYYTERALLLKEPFGDVTEAIHNIADKLRVDLNE